jgi:hypothetical protein
MRDGDAFGKQFGSLVNAAGVVDGTAGNDWFLITIKATDSIGNVGADSVNFYLADYRFSDNTQDYIVEDWQFVDLSSLGNVVGLSFTLSSSDNSLWGMNTPAYFCLDDISPSTTNLIDFEDLGFASADSVWNGSDLSGTPNTFTYNGVFSDGDAKFNNTWDSQWNYWSGGFVYSNQTDSTTSGAANVYSARAGSGKNSENYIVSMNNTVIALTGPAVNNIVSGMYLNNTTYAANSMRDGDAFGKQFGGATGNDEDWFLLTIKGYTNGNETAQSVNFYLADYRFADNARDYILKDWQWVDLTALGAIDSVGFTLTSSDTSTWGINTPSFFAIDNFNDQAVAVEKIHRELTFSMFPNPTKGRIMIELENDVNSIQVIDVTGKILIAENKISAGNKLMNLSALKAGVYFLKLDTENGSAVQRFIKN